jgi:hypothetical protein
VTHTAAFPSDAFPAFPALSLDLPDDWEAMFVPDTVLAAGAPPVPERFRTNVCISVTRTPGIRSLADAAASVTAGLEAAEQYAEVGRETRQVAGADGYRIEGSFLVDGVGTLFQAVHVAVIPRGAVTDTVTAVATATASAAHDDVPVLRTVLDSLRRDG